ncbi:MAG: glycosyltransferase [Solirubrobacteraceae bacterium]
MRAFLGAFGDPGHAFPMLALGGELKRRGHAVTIETWARWREHAEPLGLAFAPAPEYPVFPTRERPLRPYQAVARAVLETRPRIAAERPDVVVADVLTLAPALAAELEGVPAATLVPHVYPAGGDGLPPYALGARMPRTAGGRALWGVLGRPAQRGLRLGRDQYDELRTRVGLPQSGRLHGGLSPRLVLVGTFPELEYPRRWPAHVHVTGPLLWEPPFGEVDPPPGDGPLVLVAPSTSQDSSHRLLRAALAGLGGLPARVLATWNRRPLPGPARVAANTRLVEWVSYSRTMPRCEVVVCHAGHGTVARALHAGAAVVAVPAGGDMGENAARLDWAGLGVRLPWRLTGPRTLRLAVERALGDRAMAARARAIGARSAEHGGAARAADLVEARAAEG